MAFVTNIRRRYQKTMNTNTPNVSTGNRAFRSDLLKVEPDGERIPSEHEEQRAFVGSGARLDCLESLLYPMVRREE